MKFKSVGILAVGAAIGYALGTENGRKKVSELKESGNRFLNRPDVQARTTDLADKAKAKTSGLPPQVQDIANTTIDAAQRRTGQGAAADEPTDADADDAGGESGNDSTSENGGEHPR